MRRIVAKKFLRVGIGPSNFLAKIISMVVAFRVLLADKASDALQVTRWVVSSIRLNRVLATGGISVALPG